MEGGDEEPQVEAERPAARIGDVHVERLPNVACARAVTCQRPVMPAGTRKRSKW